MSEALTKEEVFQAIARRRTEVDPLEVEEWGGMIYIRRLDADDLEKTGLLDGVESVANMAVQLMVTCVANERGEPLFTESDMKELARTEFPVVLKVFGAVAKANGLSNEGLEEAMAAFAGAQRGDSSTS
jgi:hypothetical protein